MACSKGAPFPKWLVRAGALGNSAEADDADESLSGASEEAAPATRGPLVSMQADGPGARLFPG